MKLMRFVRDMPKHERGNAQYLEMLQREVDEASGEAGYDEGTDADEGEEGTGVRRDRLEDLFQMDGYNALSEAVDYEPVMYKLLNEIERRH